MRGEHLIRIWGSGSGPLRILAPPTRLIAGVLLFAATLWSRPDELLDLLSVAGLVTVWILASGLPVRYIKTLTVYGLVTFIPFFLLVPWIHPGPAFSAVPDGGLMLESFRIPWMIFTKGMATLFLAAATISALTLSDFYNSLARLPLPRLVVILIVQIAHQAGLLFDETRRIAQAMALRGATSSWKTSLLMVRSIPKVWLPRIMFRAERVAAAMEMRQYGDTVPRFDSRTLSVGDWLTVGVVTMAALLVVAS